MFHVGQKIQCIDNEEHGRYMPAGVKMKIIGHLDGLKRGRVYTVRKVGRRHPDDPMRDMVWLQEIRRPVISTLTQKYGEAGYDHRRFVPLQDKPTDISLFTAMLNQASAKQPELAQ